MHGNRSLAGRSDQDRDTGPAYWPVMVLVLGGVLTFFWIGFLLWAAFQLLDWAFG